MRIFVDAVGFEWDDGNKDKNLTKHGVTSDECETVFSDEQKLVREDRRHSVVEVRYFVIGMTAQGRLLFISYTIRRNRIRIISARDVNRKERKYYEQ